jgi:ABC-type multidrug transport system permease subunit
MAPGRFSEAIAAGLTIIGLIAVAGVRVTPPSWFPWDVIVAFGLFGLGVGALLLIRRMRRAQTVRPDNAV